MNNIIFGVYNGYNSLKTSNGGIYYFLKSLRKYNSDCKVVIICEQNNIFEDLITFSIEMNFEIYSNFTTKYNMMFYRFELYIFSSKMWVLNEKKCKRCGFKSSRV